MSDLGRIWHYGLPVLILLAGAGALSAAIRTEAGSLVSPRTYWPVLLPLLIFSGDAALGAARPPWERAEKGTWALFIWVSLAIVIWRRRQHRISAARATPAAQPDQPTR